MQKSNKQSIGKSLLSIALAVTITCLTFIQAGAIDGVSATVNNFEWDVLKLVNKQRMKSGEHPLSVFSKLQDAVYIRTKEIVNVFDHKRPDGTLWSTVFADVSLERSGAGENIAGGYQTPEEVMEGWMNSAGHRENILNENYNHIGIGYEQAGSRGTSWVQLFYTSEDCTYDSISIIEPAGGLKFPKETAIEDFNIVISLDCKTNGTSYMPLISEMTSGYNSGQAGRQEITVEVSGLSAAITVEITDDGPVKSAPFTDTDTHWARTYIDWAYDNSLFGGVTNTSFAPDQPMNRGMAATVFFRMLGPADYKGSNIYSDVPSSEYYFDAVAWASGEGIVSGIGGGRFAPEQNMTREAFAAILYRSGSMDYDFDPEPDSLSVYSDNKNIAPWAKDALIWAVGEGLIDGKSGKIDPQGNMTRAEVATILYRYNSVAQ